jgi:predicted  nucleic acid-binding Zn-ribbon protein
MYSDVCDKKSDNFDADQCTKVKNAILNQANSSGSSASSQSLNSDCSNAPDLLSSATQDLIKACGDAQLSMDGTAGNLGCSAALAKCDATQSGQDALNVDVNSDPNQPYDIAGEQQRMSKCPAYAGVNLKDLRDQIDQYQKQVDDLKKQVPDQQKAVAQAQNDSTKQMADAQKQMAQDQKDHTKEMRDITRQAEDKDKQIRDDVTQLTNQRIEKEGSISDQNVAEVKAGNDLIDQKTKVSMNCYSVAGGQIASDQKDYLARIAAGLPVQGTQQDQFSRVGMTSRQAWQKLMDRYTAWCNSAKDTKANIDAANRAYQNSYASLENEKVKAKAAIDSVNQQIAQRAADSAQNQADKLQDLQSSQADFAAQQAAAGQEMQALQSNAQQQIAAASSQLQTTQHDLANANMRLTNLQQYYNLKSKTSGGVETDQQAIKDAMSKYSYLKYVTNQIVSNPRCSSSSDSNVVSQYATSKKFLDATNEAYASAEPAPSSRAPSNTPPADSTAGATN